MNKPGRLSDAEFELMKRHAAAGGAMVECLGDPALAAAVRGHHERWDGTGYPDGLAGERIPLEARIISVADTFDAITSARPYRAATPHARALTVIDEEAGRQLDPDAARAFISCYSDRRGAALWAGLASIPRQVAGRLSTSPGELTGVLSAALTTPLVVVAVAAGAAAAPLGSGDPPTAEQQAVVASTPTGTPRPSRPPPAAATLASSTPAAATVQAATSTPAPPAVASPQPSPAGTGPPSPSPSVAPVETTPAARSVSPEPLPPLPGALPALLPTANPTAEPAPTPSAEPEPPVEPEPTLEPPVLPPVFPTPEPPSHTADDCKHGGWVELGYPNQGQCIADAEK